jgi:hypothetical protein
MFDYGIHGIPLCFDIMQQLQVRHHSDKRVNASKPFTLVFIFNDFLEILLPLI